MHPNAKHPSKKHKVRESSDFEKMEADVPTENAAAGEGDDDIDLDDL